MRTNDLLESPLYTGTPITSSVPGEQPVAIGGHPYVLEPSLYERVTVERFRNPYSQSQEPGEADLSFKGAWKRGAERWNHGMGQDFWDQFDSDRARYRLAKGIDVWSAVAGEFNQNRAQLLHDTRNIRVSSNTNLLLALGQHDHVPGRRPAGLQVHRPDRPDARRSRASSSTTVTPRSLSTI